MTAENALILLLRSEVCGKAAEVCLAEVNMQELYRFSKEQDLAHLAGTALGKLGLLGTDPVSRQFQKQAVSAVYRHARMEQEMKKICETLSQAGIRHIPLKGAVLRQSYPEAWMRTSCDIDILITEDTMDAAVAALERALDYTKEGGDAHEVSLFSANGVHLELHFDLIEEGQGSGSAAVLQRVWQDASPIQPGSMTMAMSDELFYFYHIAHMAKHFLLGGCGIRPILDIWVLNHRVSHDRQKRHALLEQGGLLTFAQTAERLSQVWFEGEQPDDLTRKTGDYLLRGGLYGDSKTIVSLRHAGGQGRFGYILSRIFLPMEQLQAEYPVLLKKKWLYPFCQVSRWFRLLFGGMAGQWLRRLWINSADPGENTGDNARLLKELDLWSE